METLTTYIKRDPIIKLDRAEIGKYLQPPKHAPTETVSKPPKESSQEVSQKWVFNYTLNIYCLHVLDPFLNIFLLLFQSAVTTPLFKIKKEAKETPLTTTKTKTVSILNIYLNIICNCPYLTLH